MRGSFSVDILRADELGSTEQALWQAFRAASPDLDSPYFDVRYTLAAGAVAPHARVGVLHRQGAPVGFFPFQRRLGMIQPLGAPMTDYHGVIAAPGERIDPAELLAALGERAFRFTGLKGAGLPQGPGLAVQPRMAADLSAGFEPWLDQRQALHPRFFKGRRRTLRAIERDLGPLRLEWSRDDGGLLDYVVALKRAQYRRTRRHDVFACGWTERLLRRLDEARSDDFGLTFASLYAGDALVGAEVGLMSGPVLHLWLPVYELEHARYGPGMLTTLESLRAAAGAGIRRADFGRADADYKAYFAEPAGTVAEGCIRAPGRLGSAAAQWLGAAAPPLAALGRRVRRRMDVISACETTARGWCAGAAVVAGVFVGAAVPTPNTLQPPRSHAQRSGSPVVSRTEGGVRQGAGHLRAPPG
jgi:CelD/BcsL family acetyltransferase involved in cellulose biosynthesis